MRHGPISIARLPWSFHRGVLDICFSLAEGLVSVLEEDSAEEAILTILRVT